MIYLNQIEVAIPDKILPVSQMEEKTELSRDMLKVFEKIYGLKEILYCDDLSLIDFVGAPVDKILSQKHCRDHIKYIIHTHTSEPVLPFGLSVSRMLKDKYQLKNAIAFGTTTHKCVSALNLFQVLSQLLKEKDCALIITGEILFTPGLRVIPRSSIAGEASAAVLMSGSGERHKLLSAETVFLPGFSEGIYLSNDELQKFDSCFVETMVNTILHALNKVRLTMDDIRLILPHNVNYLTWNKIGSALSVSMEKIYLDSISRFGHCFNSDGFLNLVFAEKDGRINKGDYYLMAGCGIGFFFSCAVFQC